MVLLRNFPVTIRFSIGLINPDILLSPAVLTALPLEENNKGEWTYIVILLPLL